MGKKIKGDGVEFLNSMNDEELQARFYQGFYAMAEEIAVMKGIIERLRGDEGAEDAETV